MGQALADILTGHLRDRGWSFKRLALEAGVPSNTVYNWTQPGIRRVHQWQHLIRLAKALSLDHSETDVLLSSGGHPPIERLLERTMGEADRKLLSYWVRTTPNNLPAQLTSFVGRRDDLDRVVRLLETARLVTLTGTGGSGKTRLAIEVAQTVLNDYDEAWFIDLAPLRDPANVLSTLCQTIGIRTSADESPLRALASHLRDRRVLLLVDNFEHVVDAAPLLTGLLSVARGVRALVTSRVRLHLRGEHEIRVAPLPLPGPAAGLDELQRNPAVALFADRAATVDPTFTLHARNAALVAAICVRLDGLPLAIELAAARVRRLSLDAMLTQVSRLAVAASGPRDLPDRQRTLRATIAWSHDLLSSEDQRVFMAAGVFVGGFTAEAIASVLQASAPDQSSEVEVGSALDALADQHVIQRITDLNAGQRFGMLETIREYALERLDMSKEGEAVRRAAAAYFIDLAERADLVGVEQAGWLRRLSDDHDNLRSTLEWCREFDESERGLRLALALIPLWTLRDQQPEALGWLRVFMAAEGEQRPDLRAKGLLWRGLLTMRGSGDDASPLFAEALALFRAADDLDGASEALQAEGDLLRDQRDWVKAHDRYAESRDLAQQAGNAYLAAHGWMGLALCAQEEERFDLAEGHWREALAWAERAGNRASVALALNGLGEMARAREDWEAAERSYERTLTIATDLDNDWRTALALHNLGYVAMYRENLDRSRTLFTDSLRLYVTGHYQKGVAECLAGLGRLALANDDPMQAARLCGASAAILDRLGTRLDSLDRADYELTLETLMSRLGERLEFLIAEGRAMSLEEALAYATSDSEPTTSN